MKKIENIRYKDTDNSAHLLDLYLPEQDEFPVFIYLHGGGIESGSKSLPVPNVYSALADKGVAVITADYRMYPDAKYPEFIEDAAAVVNWAKENMGQYGKITGYFVGGSSAGAYLSQMLCFDKKYLGKHGIDSDEIDGYIFNAGQPTTHFNVLRERGLDTRRVVVDEAAPIYHIAEDRNFAPMLITVSDNDIKNRLEQTQMLVKTLEIFGCESEKIDFRIMENTTHCSYVGEPDENGNFPFADTVYKFIKLREEQK